MTSPRPRPTGCCEFRSPGCARRWPRSTVSRGWWPGRRDICCASRTASLTCTNSRSVRRPGGERSQPERRTGRRCCCGKRSRCGVAARSRGWSSAPSVQLEAQRLQAVRLQVTEDRIDAELATGGHTVLCPELEQLVAEHPLRERLRAQLMLALYRCGRQADALETYRAGRSLLVEELAVEPGPELKQRHRAILGQDAALDLPRHPSRFAAAPAAPAAADTAAAGEPGQACRVPAPRRRLTRRLVLAVARRRAARHPGCLRTAAPPYDER